MEIIKGTVIHGQKKGAGLGFPTANIEIDLNLGIKQGIYAGYSIINNIRHKSAVYSAGGNIIEAFIMDFDGDLYGETISVEIIKKIRDRKNFNSDEEAKEQILKDILEIKKCLQE